MKLKRLAVLTMIIAGSYAIYVQHQRQSQNDSLAMFPAEDDLIGSQSLWSGSNQNSDSRVQTSVVRARVGYARARKVSLNLVKLIEKSPEFRRANPALNRNSLAGVARDPSQVKLPGGMRLMAALYPSCKGTNHPYLMPETSGNHASQATTKSAPTYIDVRVTEETDFQSFADYVSADPCILHVAIAGQTQTGVRIAQQPSAQMLQNRPYLKPVAAQPREQVLFERMAARVPERTWKVAYVGGVSDLSHAEPRFFVSGKKLKNTVQTKGRVVASGRMPASAAPRGVQVHKRPYPVETVNGMASYTRLNNAITQAVRDGNKIVNVAMAGVDRTYLEPAIAYARSRGVLVVNLPADASR